jgi:thiol-disulfide isomerase/thioredoxin
MTAAWRTPSGLHVASARLPDEGELPSFAGATGWFNSPPLTPAGLRGKVVLVDFWTYTCVNWLRTLPYVRAWAGKYAEHGLAVIGVHTQRSRRTGASRTASTPAISTSSWDRRRWARPCHSR